MTFRRVVVALDTASPARAAAMATAIAFARALEAELVGLFVEDPDLISLASLTAAEIGFPFPAHRALDVGTIERGLRARARLVRADLVTRLANAPLKWTFEVVRGRTASALDAIVARDDVVVVPLPGAAAPRAFAPLRVARLYVRQPLSEYDRIAILPAEDTPAEDVARLVRALAPRHGRTVRLLVAGPDARWRPWAQALDCLLAEAAITTRVHALADDANRAISQAIAASPPGLVIALAPTRQAHADLVDALPLPLLVLPGPAGRDPRTGR